MFKALEASMERGTDNKLVWENLSKDALSYFDTALMAKNNGFTTLAPGACTIKLLTAVIYGFL